MADFRFIRRHPDGREEVSNLAMDLTEVAVGQRLASAAPGKSWEFTEIDADTEPATIIAELVDDE